MNRYTVSLILFAIGLLSYAQTTDVTHNRFGSGVVSVINANNDVIDNNASAVDSVRSGTLGAGMVTGDTAAMLAPYIERGDTAAMLSNYALLSESGAGAMSYTDTSAMLTPYIERSDTSAMLSDYALLSEAGTGDMSYADTSAMLTSYIERGDTATMLSDYALLSEAASSGVDGVARSQLSDSLKQFNVLSYGADPTGVENSADNFRLAVADVVAAGGGIVLAPEGTYLFSDSVILASDVKFDMLAADVIFPEGYSGTAFYWGAGDGNLINCFINGGNYGGHEGDDGYGYQWTCIKLVSSNSTTNFAMLDHFDNMFIYRAKIGFDFSTSATGWINAGYANNNTFWQCGSAVKTREPTGLGIDGWMFSNTNIQAGDSTTFGINALSGQSNQFIGLNFYDFPAYGNAATVTLASTSSDNVLIGKAVAKQGYVDDGDNNYVVTDGQVFPWKIGITDNTFQPVVVIDFDSSMMVGGTVDYTVVIATAAGDSMQVQTGSVSFSAFMLTDGTFVSSIDATGNNIEYIESHAALTIAETWQVQNVVAAADYIRLRIKIDTNIGVPVITMYYHVTNNSHIPGYL